MVEEAGGTVTRMDGEKFCVFDRSVLVSNGVLHAKVSLHFPFPRNVDRHSTIFLYSPKGIDLTFSIIRKTDSIKSHYSHTVENSLFLIFTATRQWTTRFSTFPSLVLYLIHNEGDGQTLGFLIHTHNNNNTHRDKPNTHITKEILKHSNNPNFSWTFFST
ncbi:hypothetical protein Ddye_029754 [Dipteronia dyeriana]|nr:hypothetical protein Ddye_029754 [Dipteronia dyeriana]